MKVFIVITVNEGEPDTFGDIVGVYKTDKKAQEVVKDIQLIKTKDKFDEKGILCDKYGISPEFDIVTYLEHTLKS